MKKTLLVIMAVLFGLNAMAQTEGGIKVRRPKYVTLGYVLQQDVTLASGEVIKPEFGAMLNRGRTFYLHKKPIANFLNIGIDATWIDMNYAMYKPQTLESALHQAELAVQVGPSFTFTPVKRLQVHLYGRFAPTFALRYDGETVGGNYASMFVAGGNLSFGFFGVANHNVCTVYTGGLHCGCLRCVNRFAGIGYNFAGKGVDNRLSQLFALDTGSDTELFVVFVSTYAG